MAGRRDSSSGDSNLEVSPESIQHDLGKRVVGSSILYFDETVSTNSEAKKLAEEGAVEGATIIAGVQSAGKGRLGREWFSPKGGVWMSIILRPSSLRPLQKLTLLAGLSVAKTLKNTYGIDAHLKWPNDVTVRGEKICGILVEGSFEGEAPLFVVMGIGLNANIDPASFPQELGTEATSIRKLLGRDVSLNELITHLLTTIDGHYALFSRGEDKKIWREYEKLCATIGSRVRVECGKEEVYEGLAKGISPDGGLIIRTGKHSTTTVLAGDCIHLKDETTKNIKVERRKLRH